MLHFNNPRLMKKLKIEEEKTPEQVFAINKSALITV